MAEATETNSPFPPGLLTEEHERQMLAIHACLEEWVNAHNDSRKNVEGAKERLKVATDKLAKIAQRLETVPPYGKRVPKLKGKRCVQKAGELNEREYEGLMRTAMFVAMGLVPDFVIKWWRELGEVGVMNWEEQD
ncbi:hypothetical protein NLJ89_g5973 [Agrocybe chaxingu]|uniref:Uncharacterized protein n=1 Tax=Agrocybe chaxingu TaxID=84603 RepID=A0A9W8JXD9_9AGAR|nr:hypothetical protein NLJ89_g5973 [Agrocybe chaxingu]